ncbi:hypothetical protein H5410_014406 [Solanum commersonii]|uniref:Uncharacterized protein n=1 Tax=Solanum commersonii TaxID=4109 RepID=A0A9J5ZQW2_SOLCO|nr:hypothetical protein H5410_014406 [Solanum commersonii]
MVDSSIWLTSSENFFDLEMPKSLLDCWKNQKTTKRLKQIWRTIPLNILWTLWLERNKRCFEDKKKSNFFVKTKCIHNL